jgi:hypothetical protein
MMMIAAASGIYIMTTPTSPTFPTRQAFVHYGASQELNGQAVGGCGNKTTGDDDEDDVGTIMKIVSTRVRPIGASCVETVAAVDTDCCYCWRSSSSSSSSSSS